LGFSPYYGATQIMPRIIYAPVAEALADMVQLLHKFALDVRLNARSGRPLMREPFSKTQKGSSAMPHKKNPVRLEQIEGMARMANGYEQMIRANIPTWEERAIEQSCVDYYFFRTEGLSGKYALGNLRVARCCNVE
jgi:adenylosuccinate lyase